MTSWYVKKWDGQIVLLIFAHARTWSHPTTPNHTQRLEKKTRQKHQSPVRQPDTQNGFELKVPKTAKRGQLSKNLALEGSPGKTGLVRVKVV